MIKKKDHDKRKTEKTVQPSDGTTPNASPPASARSPSNVKDEYVLQTPAKGDESRASPMSVDPKESPSSLKRRREEQETNEGAETEDSASKKLRSEQIPQQHPPPPPPPPPPTESANGVTLTELGRTPSEEPTSEDGPGFTIKGIARASSIAAESPMQVATPPTTGSPDGSEREKRRREYTGMNPDRMRLMNAEGR